LLGEGATLVGGGVGAALFLLPSLSLELVVGGASLLPSGVITSGAVLDGTLSVSWLPVRLGVFRAGPRASVSGGALFLAVDMVNSTLPWLSLGGGATVGLEFRHLAIQLFGEVGSVLVGAVVLAEGLPVQRVRGLEGSFGAQVSYQW
jgi:hypothetical protein